MFLIGVTGGRELADALNELSTGIRKRKLVEILNVAAEPMRQRMAQNAAKGSATYARRYHAAGHLADSMTISTVQRTGEFDRFGGAVRTDEQQAAVAVGPDRSHFYGGYLEFGTVHLGAMPFARPAFDAVAPKSLDIIRAELWDLLRQLVTFRTASAPTTPTAGGVGGGGLL